MLAPRRGVSPVLLRNTLGTLRAKFEQGAERFPNLRYRYVQFTDQSRDQVATLPFEYSLRHAAATSGGIMKYTVIRTRSDDRLPSVFEVSCLPPRLYLGAFFGEGSQEFKKLAATTAQVLLNLPIPLPVPEHALSDVGHSIPSVKQILPSCYLEESNRWIQALLWISWSGTHCVLQDNRKTWNGPTRLPYDTEQLEILRKAPPGDPIAQAMDGILLPPDHFYCGFDDLFENSVWGIDRLLAELESQPAVSPAMPSVLPAVPCQSTGGLSVVSRALSLAFTKAREGKALNVSEIARELGCDRSHLQKSEPSMAFVKAMRADKNRLPRGRKDRKTRKLDAWKEDADGLHNPQTYTTDI